MMTPDELGGGATVPAETPTVALPNPINTEAQGAEQQRQTDEAKEVERVEAEKARPEEKPEPKKPISSRDALKKASETIEAQEKASEKPRDETGKFTAKDGAAKPAEETTTAAKPEQQQAKPAEPVVRPKVPHDDAPRRLDDAAKKEWANAPEPVRGAVHRTISELEQGITEHQQRWEKIKPYADLAEQNGTTIHQAMDRYIAFERSLNDNLAQGLEGVIRDVTGGKMGLRDVAARVMGQTPAEAQTESDATIAGLRKEIGDLRQQMQGLGGTMRQQVETKAADEITAFWAENPDAEDLAEEMVPHLKAGKSIREAYDLSKAHVEGLAAKFGFTRSPAPAQTRTEPIPNPAEAQTLDRGSKSISGAPSAGAEPVRRQPSSSVRDAVRKAMQAAGV